MSAASTVGDLRRLPGIGVDHLPLNLGVRHRRTSATEQREADHGIFGARQLDAAGSLGHDQADGRRTGRTEVASPAGLQTGNRFLPGDKDAGPPVGIEASQEPSELRVRDRREGRPQNALKFANGIGNQAINQACVIRGR